MTFSALRPVALSKAFRGRVLHRAVYPHPAPTEFASTGAVLVVANAAPLGARVPDLSRPLESFEEQDQVL